MFRLNGQPVDITRIDAKELFHKDGLPHVLVLLRAKVHLETRDELLGVAPGYQRAIQAILEQSEDWGEGERVDLKPRISQESGFWSFDLTDVDAAREGVEFVAHVTGTPRLRIQPDKETSLTLVLSGQVDEPTLRGLLLLLGPGVPRIYYSSAQRGLFEDLEVADQVSVSIEVQEAS